MDDGITMTRLPVIEMPRLQCRVELLRGWRADFARPASERVQLTREQLAAVVDDAIAAHELMDHVRSVPQSLSGWLEGLRFNCLALYEVTLPDRHAFPHNAAYLTACREAVDTHMASVAALSERAQGSRHAR